MRTRLVRSIRGPGGKSTRVARERTRPAHPSRSRCPRIPPLPMSPAVPELLCPPVPMLVPELESPAAPMLPPALSFPTCASAGAARAAPAGPVAARVILAASGCSRIATAQLRIGGPGLVEAEERDLVGGVQVRVGAVRTADLRPCVENRVPAGILPLLAIVWMAADRHRRRRPVPAQSQDVGPLLDGLGVVGKADRAVRLPVPKLNAGARSAVPGVHVANHGPPLRRRVRDLTAGARAAPLAGGIIHGPASGWNARELGASLEDLGINGDQTLRHHGAGRGPGYVDAVGVRVVLGDRVLHHVDDRPRVATTVVREGWLGRDVPAVLRGLRQDHEKAVFVGGRYDPSTLRLAEHARRVSAAVMDSTRIGGFGARFGGTYSYIETQPGSLPSATRKSDRTAPRPTPGR